MRIPALLIALIAPSGLAHAADCAEIYTIDALLSDLSAVEIAAQEGQADGSLTSARNLQAGLACMDERLVPALVGRTYRSIGAGMIVGGDTERGQQWFATAVEVDPQFSFGVQEFADGHPVQAAYRKAKDDVDSAQSVKAGAPFAEGKFYLDGRSLSEPEATLGRPHLFQRNQDGVTSWIIEGAAFPDSVLAAESAVASASADEGKSKSKDKSKDKSKRKDKAKDAAPAKSTEGLYVRERPPEKTPLIIGGATIIVGAGAMYGAAVLSRRKFDGIGDSESDLRRAQLTTNRLYMGSIALLAVGVGTTTWGVILDGHTAMPHMSVRF